MTKCALASLLFISLAVSARQLRATAAVFRYTVGEGRRSHRGRPGRFRSVLQMESGAAIRRDVRLENGTIELDVQGTRQRSFVYLYFRMQSDEEREEVYRRF